MPSASARRCDSLLALALFAAAFALFAALAPRTLELRDEGYLYAQTARTAAGELPHRDFDCIYGPGTYAVTAWLYSAFGEEILPVRLALAAMRAAGVALVYGVARHLAPPGYAAAAALASLAFGSRVIWNLNTPYAATYSLPLGLLALFLMLRGLARDSRALLVASGLAAGAGVLFKQSLGLMLVYGLLLGLAAASALASERDAGPAPAPPARRGLAPWLWLAAAALPLSPFARRLGAADFALHFLPLGLAALLFGLRSRRFAAPIALRRLLLPRAACFAAGAAAAPLATAALYAEQGGLAALLEHMFLFPAELVHYDLPVRGPSRAGIELAAGAACAAGALLALARKRWLAAAIGAAGPLVLLSNQPSWQGLGAEIESAVSSWFEPLPGLIAAASLLPLARDLARPARAGSASSAAFGAVLLFQCFLGFQVYPRAGFNIFLLLPLLPMLLAGLAWRLRRWAAPARASRPQRAAAAAAALLPLLLLAGPGFRDSLREATRRADASTRLALPGLRGIAPPPDFSAREQLAAFAWLAEHLARIEPRDAPLALLGNQFMLHVVSPRADLFADAAYYLHLFGWDLLPSRLRERARPRELLARLRAHPQAPVVTVDDFASANLRRVLPELFAFVETHYRESYRVGLYRVWLRKPV